MRSETLVGVPASCSLGSMAKYDPLRDYLLRQRAAEVDLSFREIERKLGYMLPNRAARPEWWASAGAPGPGEVQKQAWRAAGYDAALVGEERVQFRRHSMPATAE